MMSFPSKQMLIDALDGMFWAHDDEKFDLPRIDGPKKASMIYRKNIVEITWNSLVSFERNPTTLPQTATILRGQSVGGVSIGDLLQVKNYGDAGKLLVDLVVAGDFGLNSETSCRLHQLAGKEDALEWGVFRYLKVGIYDVEYTPPDPEVLPDLARRGFAFLNESIEDPCERAVAAFLFMSRSQFFFDANKRTASLIMNGVLMSNGYFPMTVLNKESEEFHKQLGRFYETGDATPMMRFFRRMAAELYQGRSAR